MPRYFFHVRDIKDFPDDTGTDLANDDDARAQAILSAGAMLEELGDVFWNYGEWTMHVQREDGSTLCGLTFSAQEHDQP